MRKMMLVAAFLTLVPMTADSLPLILHARMDGSYLYLTDARKSPAQTNEIVELIRNESNQGIAGVGFHKNHIYMATNRGAEVLIQKLTLEGVLVEEFTVETENGNRSGTLFDMAFDYSGFWAVNQYIMHYDMKTLEIDIQFELPEGHNSNYGIAYDYRSKTVFVVALDQVNFPDRNCPVVIAFDRQGKEKYRIKIPVDSCFEIPFGLGFDQQSQTLWFSISHKEIFLKPNHLVEMTLDGEVVRILPLNHQYGTVECINRARRPRPINAIRPTFNR